MVWPLSPSLAATKEIDLFFLFLRVLRCFSSPGALLLDYFIHPMVTGHYPRRVPPFGYRRLNARLQLPVAFRSLPRPSSAISALASTLCPYSLDLSLPRSLRFLLSFASCLCSFQGAHEVPLSDPSKRYRLRKFSVSSVSANALFTRPRFSFAPCGAPFRLGTYVPRLSTSGPARSSLAFSP